MILCMNKTLNKFTWEMFFKFLLIIALLVNSTTAPFSVTISFDSLTDQNITLGDQEDIHILSLKELNTYEQQYSCNLEYQTDKSSSGANSFIDLNPEMFNVTSNRVDSNFTSQNISFTSIGKPEYEVKATYLIVCPLVPGNSATFIIGTDTIGEQEGDGHNNRIIITRPPQNTVGSQGDPHFSQLVGKKGNLLKICYDVIGTSSQNILILTNNKYNISISGLLLDDYYMHQIKIIFNGKSYNIGRENIELADNQRMLWKENIGMKIENERDGYVIEIGKSKIEVELKNSGIEIFQVVVEKSVNNIIGEYLNVFFPKFSANYENVGGLMGVIGNKNFVVESSSVQASNENILVLVDDRTIEAKKVIRQTMDCLLMKTDDLLYPKKLSEFVY